MRQTGILLIIIFLFVNFTIAQQKPYRPLRIKNNVTLDGKLTEPEWQQAETETDFMQYDPTAGAQPTERSEIRILYNDAYLFVGLRAYDQHPEKLIRYSLQRDFEPGNDDGFFLAIDMYNDKNTGLSFGMNILGARLDAEVSGDGANYNNDYNTFWDVVSSVDSLGYTTELRIPFSSLRFVAKDTVRMGFIVTRLIKRLNEFDIYPRIDPRVEDAYSKMSLAREMEFYNLRSRKPFYITPYVIANYSEQNILNGAGTAYEKQSQILTQKQYFNNRTLDKIASNIGVDVKYGITKNFTLDVTLNTDFAQAESDNVIVNLTKYEVNLPEKRSFFLESQNYLSFTSSIGNELFISRSIGLENNTIVPIIGGVRLTGKSNGWQMGLLDMQTKSIGEDSIDAHNIFVFRSRKDIDSIGSFAGGIITNSINTSGSHSSTQSFGLDIVKKLNSQVTFSLLVAGTTVNGKFQNIHKQMNVNAGIFRTAKQGWYYGADVDLIGKDFSPSLGYVQENDLLTLRGDMGYNWQASEESKKAFYYLHGNLLYKRKPDLKIEETKYAGIQTGVGFKTGASIDITAFEYQSDVVLDDWQLTDHITIPAGKYKMFSPDITFTSPQKSKYRGSLFIKLLDFYGGKRITLIPGLTYVFNKHFYTTAEYEYDRIKFPVAFSNNGNRVFQSSLARLSISYFFSAAFSVKLLSQFDQLNNSVNSNLRFRYNPHEGTDLYILVNQDLNSNSKRLTPGLPLVKDQAFVIKFLKTLSIKATKSK